MRHFVSIDRASDPISHAVAQATSGSVADIAELARTHPWDETPIPVMAAILKRPDCPLGTALTIFLRCSPGLWRDEGISTDLKLAEIIEKAVNAGRFTHNPAFGVDDHARRILANYAIPPGTEEPRAWALCPDILAPLLDTPKAAAKAEAAPSGGFLAGFLAFVRPPHRA